MPLSKYRGANRRPSSSDGSLLPLKKQMTIVGRAPTMVRGNYFFFSSLFFILDPIVYAKYVELEKSLGRGVRHARAARYA